MKRAIAIITAACVATPAFAWGDREQGVLAGIFGTLIVQQMQRDGFGRHPGPQPVYVPGPVVVQQPPVVVTPPAPPVVIQQPQTQVILQNTGIVCPQGLAAFFNQRIDRHGRPYFVFDGCR